MTDDIMKLELYTAFQTEIPIIARQLHTARIEHLPMQIGGAIKFFSVKIKSGNDSLLKLTNLVNEWMLCGKFVYTHISTDGTKGVIIKLNIVPKNSRQLILLRAHEIVLAPATI